MRKLLMTVIVAVALSAATPAQCNWPPVTPGWTTNQNVSCQDMVNKYWVEVADAVYWPGGVQHAYLYVSQLPCGSSFSVTGGWSTRSVQTGWNQWSIFSVWTARLYVNGTLWAQGETSGCMRATPILINFEPGGNNPPMTSAADGVDFDMFGNGTTSRLSWTAANANVAWLVHGSTVPNGTVLWGNRTTQAPEAYPGEEANGYRALRLYDLNQDGEITDQDAIYHELSLWFDRNKNGIDDFGEVVPLASLVRAISLDYKVKEQRQDQHGNLFRYRSDATLLDGAKRTTYDVIPAQ